MGYEGIEADLCLNLPESEDVDAPNELFNPYTSHIRKTKMISTKTPARPQKAGVCYIYSLAVGERLPTFRETYLCCLSVTSRIRAVTEGARKTKASTSTYNSPKQSV
ncbi:hypothetical protein BpHYR1_048478 [Brachionus plicatilis]|uniref:Uncharacterized protein n=1 Tax=Brachionus plicatilis TaxID=10195 RepID=A0A3M7PLN6_BRAPC|nr:hypothetical protein BpHYR1_048478 [Brachionus plicatilis]